MREREYGELSRSLPGFSALGEIDLRTPTDGPWAYTVEFEHPAPMHEFQELRVLRPRPVKDIRVLQLPSEEQEHDLHHPFLATFRAVDEIRLQGQRLVRWPDAFRTENSVGRVSVSVTREDGSVILSREIEFLTVEIAPDQREEVLELRRALRRANRAAIVLGVADSAVREN